VKIFGFEIVRAARPSLAEILPPFNQNPPLSPSRSSSDVFGRQIHEDPRSSFYLGLPSKLHPRIVEQILRSAAGGDIWQQWQLFTRMLDSWVMLRKCCHELQSAVSQTKFVVRPFALVGKEPTAQAVKRADFCSSALQRMKPDPMTDEQGFAGMLYHLTNAFINGISMVEILWDESGSDIIPRATAFVHPRHYTFTTDAKIAIVDGNYRNFGFPNPTKFIVGQFSAHSGSALTGGILRPLAWWWSAIMYNREWMLEFAQRFGQPFRWSTYKAGTPTDEIQKINDNLKNMGASAWASFVEGATVNFEQPGTLGPQQPQIAIMDAADKSCQLLILGQTLTSDVHQSGSRALGSVHENVRRERIEDLSKWCGRILSEQLLPALCRLNYNDDSECPTIEPEFTEEENPLSVAQRFQIMLQLNMPVNAEQAYREMKLELPQEGDKVLIGGKLGVLGSTDEELSASPAPMPAAVPGTVPGQNSPGNEPPQNGNGKTNGAPKPGNEPLAARAWVMAQDAGKKHVLPNFKARLVDLREARQEDFEPLLDRIAELEGIEDADDLKEAIESLKADLPGLATAAMESGKASEVVAEMIGTAFARGLTQATKRRKQKSKASVRK
jgi:phage gp29-like protein